MAFSRSVDHAPSFDIEEIVVPVFGIKPDGEDGPFLGSGFFVKPSGTIITCSHVLKEWNGSYGISPKSLPDRLVAAEVIARDEAHDLAALRVATHIPANSFLVEESTKITLNRMVCSCEYGPSMSGGPMTLIESASRVGNVTRLRDMRSFGKGGSEAMLELSFPALRGASGAPVAPLDSPLRLWGVLQGNTAHEIHPAQVEMFYEEDKVTSETRFYLPQSVAVNVYWVWMLLNSIA